MRPGTQLGPYEIIEAIGRGGMGEVYRARDTRLHRQVAIKIVTPDGVADPAFQERFTRETRAVAALSHPNVVGIYDVGTYQGAPYAAIELLEGQTLREAIASPLPLATALDYAGQIGRGLAAAHDRGIVHRDLKPENIFVTRDGQVKILDFGLATAPPAVLSDEATRAGATEHGAMLGTVGYMSPEQTRGERADARSDIFSFGCVLYEMIAGRRAFDGGGAIETLHAILKDHPPDLAASAADVPPAVERLVRRCLAKTPEGRFQTARDLVFALENMSEDLERTPAGLLPRAGRRRAGPRVAAALLVGTVLAGVLALWQYVSREMPSSAAPASGSASDPRRLLAVLPFANISGEGAGYFAAGMTEEVASQLSKLGALRVVGRAAVAKFKDARSDLPAMVEELGIGSVITGTVRQEGSRVRVNVELMDAQSGQVIWSDQYDREGVDVFAAQSDIALRVAGALNASVTLDEQARVGRRPTSSVAAYELFVRARSVRANRTEDVLQGRIDLLQKAVAADPDFAQAYGELAIQHYFQAAYGDLSAIARGLAAAHRAIEIDPAVAAGHRGLGLNLQQVGRLREALTSYRRAVELDPNYTGGLLDVGLGELTAGRFDEALRHSTRALALTSNTAVAYYHVGVGLLFLDDDERTERFLTGAARRFPTDMRLQILLSVLDLRRDRPAAALDRIRRAAETAPGNIEVLLTRAEIATFAGAAEAPGVVRALLARSGEGLFGHAPYPVKLAHAYHLQRAGAASEAARLMDAIVTANKEAVTAGADWPMVFMQNAAVQALRGDTTAALDSLEGGYAAGWRDHRLLAVDPLLAPLRTSPRFAQLLSRIEADVAAMRGRADYSGVP